jgi:hypothetical protein
MGSKLDKKNKPAHDLPLPHRKGPRPEKAPNKHSVPDVTEIWIFEICLDRGLDMICDGSLAREGWGFVEMKIESGKGTALNCNSFTLFGSACNEECFAMFIL